MAAPLRLLLLAPALASAFSPFEPTAGWTYYLEAAHDGPATEWPQCPFRFLSFPGTCDAVNLWRGAGVNQRFTLAEARSGGAFTVQAGCGKADAGKGLALGTFERVWSALVPPHGVRFLRVGACARR